MSQHPASAIATTVAVDARAFGLVIVPAVILGLVLILSAGAAWLHAT